MASFAYSAINAEGLELSGEVNAPDETSAREALRVRGLLALELTQRASSSQGIGVAVKKVKPKSLQIFSRQFATMIEAGLNVVTALVILEEQTEDKKFASVISEVRADVEGGLLLSEALARHPRIFSRLYIAMVEAGEAAGILDVVLDRVAIQIEKETKIKRRVKGAMMYPLMVLLFATLVLIGMLMFLVPVFVGIFAQLGGDLPTLTQYVLKASNIVRNQYYILFPGIALVIWSFFRFKKTETGRRHWDRFRMKLPVSIGSTIMKIGMARFSRTLSTLVGSGVDIIRALEITGSTSGNSLIEDAVVEVQGESAPGRAHRGAAHGGSALPADGLPDGSSRRGDRRARKDAREDRRLLRGRSRQRHRDAYLGHRAAHDDRRRPDGRSHHHQHVPADVQAPVTDRRLVAGQPAVGRNAVGSRLPR